MPLAALTACHEPKTVDQLVAELRAPEAKMRRRAADGLGREEVDPRAIQPLLEAIAVEKDKSTYGAMLIALGRSGVPEAKAIVDARLPDPDRDMRRWAGRALKYWMLKTGQLPRDYDFPDNWPYGQPGYPPLLPGSDDDDDD